MPSGKTRKVRNIKIEACRKIRKIRESVEKFPERSRSKTIPLNFVSEGIRLLATPLTRLTDFKTWTFSTSHELIHILKNSTSLAEDFVSIRTETGPLHGELRVANNNNSGHISLIANQPLFCCSRTFSGSSICFSTVIDERKQIKANHYHNYSNNLLGVLDTVLTGFSKESNFCFVHLPRGVRIFIYHCEEQKILEALKHEGLELNPYRTKSNTILSKSEAMEKFRRVIKGRLNLDEGQNSSSNDPGNTEQETIQTDIAACFREAQEQNPIPLKMIQRYELCKDLVAWGFKNPDQPQSLEGMIKELQTTRASLSQGCKESLGIAKMEVLRNIRLEHIHEALKDPQIRQRLDVKSIEEIRKHYSFQSRATLQPSMPIISEKNLTRR